MKVVLIDNLNREYIADKLLKDNLSKEDATRIAAEYNKKYSHCEYCYYAVVREDNYKLWGGIEELI